MQCCTCIQNTESTNSIHNPTMSHSQINPINMTLCDSYKCTKTGIEMLCDYSNSPKIFRKNSKLSISDSPPFIKRISFSDNSSPSYSDNSSPSYSDNSSPSFSDNSSPSFSDNSSPPFSKKFDRPILNYNEYLQKYKANEILEKMFKE